MALLYTPEKDKNLHLIDFSLKNIDGKMIDLEDVRSDNGTVLMFICNHCPYVLAVIDRMVQDCKILQNRSIGCAAIMSNDTLAYPADSFENMKIFSKEHDFSFPYLFDETQDIARSYGAICTPDFFGFDANGRLQYRGRLDSAVSNEADENTTHELQEAMLEIAETGRYSHKQYPSMGCSIKWKS